MASVSAIESAQGIYASLSPLDWLLVAIAAWCVVRGFLHGAIRELFAVLASVMALITAYWQYHPVAAWMGRWIESVPERYALAFLLVAFATFLAVVLLGRAVRAIAHVAGLGLLDRLAGGALGVAQAALVGTILITTLSTFLPTGGWVEQSRLARCLAAPAKILARAAPVELQQRIAASLDRLNMFRNSLR